MNNCQNCESRGQSIATVPFASYEAELVKNERTTRRMIAAIVVAFLSIVATNALWLYAWCQYDYESSEIICTQDGEGLNIIGCGNEAGIYGSDDNNQEEKENKEENDKENKKENKESQKTKFRESEKP